MSFRRPWVVALALGSWVVATVASAAGDCRPVRLDGPQMPFSRIPEYSQSGVGICYAYNAAQLIDAYRFSGIPGSLASPGRGGEKISGNTSPGIVALDYMLEEEVEESFSGSGGVTCAAVEAARKRGLCLSTGADAPRKIAKLQAEMAVAKKRQIRRDHPKCFQSPETEAAIHAAVNLATVRAVSAMVTRKCKRIRAGIPACRSVTDETVSSRKFRQMIDGSLDGARPMPVEVGLSNHLFSYDNYHQKRFRIERVPTSAEEFSKYNAHSVMVIGRAPAPDGACRYLIRNTNVFCPSDAKERGWECVTSNTIWIPETDLMDAVFQVSGFSDAIRK